MAIERQTDTNIDPDVIDQTSSVRIIPEPSRNDEIRNAANILVNEEEILIDDEINAEEPMPQMNFSSNLVDFVDESVLRTLASDLVSSVEGDKQSRSEWVTL